jgi:hypothetical protein
MGKREQTPPPKGARKPLAPTSPPQPSYSNLQERVRGLEKWVNDLQSGGYVNCVYCGYRYGPALTTPVSMAGVLKKHVERCSKHPMSALKRRLFRAEEVINVLDNYLLPKNRREKCWIDVLDALEIYRARKEEE